MDFFELINNVNNLSLNSEDEIASLVNEININTDNFNQWINYVFSEKVDLFDMKKLPYLIDELYKTSDKMKFMLCCMLIESTCDKLDFITNLENYSLFAAKFETMLHTLVTVYDKVDNGIANCMSLIIINNDPEFKYFNDELKNIMIDATKRKLKDILKYLKTQNINPIVYNDLEIIVDMSCYLKNKEISEIIDEIDKCGINENADIFIMKYKIINNMNISKEKIDILKQDKEKIWLLHKIMEGLNVNDFYLNDVSQETIARSEMIRWLKYPTEIGSLPDKIELLGEFIFNNTRCFSYKFSKENFKISGDLLGVSGGYPIDKTSSISCGYTFSKFEKVSKDWKKQANELVELAKDKGTPLLEKAADDVRQRAILVTKDVLKKLEASESK